MYIFGDGIEADLEISCGAKRYAIPPRYGIPILAMG
jgi:hypothetical protein